MASRSCLNSYPVSSHLPCSSSYHSSMANNECCANKNTSSSSSSSVCEVSMLLVSNIIRLSCRSLFGGQTKNLPPNYYSSNDEPPLLQDHHHHERLPRVSRKPSAASKIKVTQESADSVRVTKPSSYVVKSSGHDEVGETLTRKETYNNNDDNVDAHAGTYINQVRQKIINGNHHHVNQ